MWCLSRLLPLLIGERVPVDNPNWKNFLLLREILDYVLAPTLTHDCSAYLKSLINEHHLAFKELYPTSSITPKLHYLIHYPEAIERSVFI